MDDFLAGDEEEDEEEEEDGNGSEDYRDDDDSSEDDDASYPAGSPTSSGSPKRGRPTGKERDPPRQPKKQKVAERKARTKKLKGQAPYPEYLLEEMQCDKEIEVSYNYYLKLD